MSTDSPSTSSSPAVTPPAATAGNKGTNWLGVIALVVVCLIFGSLGGAVAGGAAGYFLGAHAARSETAQATGGSRQRQIVPPQGWSDQWPQQNQPQIPNVAFYAQVESVVAGSPAEKAGIRVGDQITAVNGQQLTARRDLAQAISSNKIGDQVQLTIERNGAEDTIKVTLGEHPDKAGSAYMGLTYTMQTGIGSRYPSS